MESKGKEVCVCVSHLRGVVDDRGDLLGVTLEGGDDLLLLLIKHHHVLISPACRGRQRERLGIVSGSGQGLRPKRHPSGQE